MQLLDKITTPAQLLEVEGIKHSAFLKECEKLYGPLDDSSLWKYRERLRSLFIYKEINFEGEPFHFVHLNPEDPTVIAYTPDDSKGKRDIKTLIKPGKYLANHTDLDNEKIKEIITDYKHRFLPPELEFSKDANDAVRIYEEGPNSCMCRKGWDHKKEHPALVYAGPDVGVAYIRRNNKIVARTVIRTDRKPPEYIRVYGDEGLMKKALQANGIKLAQDGLKGCRLPVVWRGKNPGVRLVMPYLDGKAPFIKFPKDAKDENFVNEEFVKAVNETVSGRLKCHSTDGYLVMPNTEDCRTCGQRFHLSQMHRVSGVGYYCRTCFAKKLVSDDLEEVVTSEGHRVYPISKVRRNRRRYAMHEGLYHTRDALKQKGLCIDALTHKVVPVEGYKLCAHHDAYFKEENMAVLQRASGLRYMHVTLDSEALDTGSWYYNPKSKVFYNWDAVRPRGCVAFHDYCVAKLSELKKSGVHATVEAAVTNMRGLNPSLANIFIRTLRVMNDRSDELK